MVSALLFLSVSALATACGLFDAPPALPTAVPPQSNLLTNPGFESATEGWVAAVTPPAPATLPLSAGHPHGGSHSLDLRLEADEGDAGARASLAVQSIGTAAFPEYVSGFYRVDDWRPLGGYQDLEFVVTVRNADFDQGGGTREVRFLLGALELPPPERNHAYVFLSRAAPVLHKWVYVGYPVRQAFESRFGPLPTHWDGIDIAVGVSIDGRRPEDQPASADVLFDDLYAGPQADNPNRPPDEP